jgi:hypothetical protein
MLAGGSAFASRPFDACLEPQALRFAALGDVRRNTPMFYDALSLFHAQQAFFDGQGSAAPMRVQAITSKAHPASKWLSAIGTSMNLVT